jgi:hypothetical protein
MLKALVPYGRTHRILEEVFMEYARWEDYPWE